MIESEDKSKYENGFKSVLINFFLNSVYQVIKNTRANKILDIGCGEGYPDNFFLKKDKTLKITGIDENEIYLLKAKNKNPEVKYLSGNVNNLSSINNKFDLVLLMEVLEHLQFPQKALSEVIKCSTKAIITIPYEPWFSIMSFVSGNRLKNFGQHPGHINNWNRNSIKRFLLHYYKDVKIKVSFPWIIAFCSNK